MSDDDDRPTDEIGAPAVEDSEHPAIIELPVVTDQDRLAALARVLARIVVEQAIFELDDCTTLHDSGVHATVATNGTDDPGEG
jgi:hypothetical protein